jgi:hypothetical protein
VEAAVRVSVPVPFAAIGFALNDCVRPVGKLLAVKLTLPENAPAGVTLITVFPAAPCAIEIAAGAVEIEKLAGGFTVRVRVVL